MSTSADGFWSANETMDLTDLYPLQYCVAINFGHPDDGRYLCKTIKGPFTFDEVVGHVHRMWSEDLDQAKVIILDKDPKAPHRTLDAKTIEYMQMRAGDILIDRMLTSDTPKEYTCKAGVVETVEEKEEAADGS